jgi:hypothetical protein
MTVWNASKDSALSEKAVQSETSTLVRCVCCRGGHQDRQLRGFPVLSRWPQQRTVNLDPVKGLARIQAAFQPSRSINLASLPTPFLSSEDRSRRRVGFIGSSLHLHLWCVRIRICSRFCNDRRGREFAMAAADVRDMLDLPADGQPRPLKKQKVVEKRPGKS